MDNYAALFGKSLGAGSGGSGTDNYNDLNNKPSINGTVLSGNKTAANLGLQSEISDLAEIRSGAAAGATAVQPADMSAVLAEKQDKLTFDSTPTESSTNPVTSGGVWTDQQRQEVEIGAVANAGAKNLLKIIASSQTIRGVTFTVNDDQTVTVNGTNDGTGASTLVIVPNAQAITIPDGNYILSGCPASGEGTATAPYDLRWYLYSQGKSSYDIGAGALVTKNGNTTDSNIAIIVKTGQTANNLIFKPMLRRAEITDDTFVPYAPTNRELYEMILALQNRASTQSTESLMSAKSTIDTDVVPEEGEKKG